MDYRKPHRFDPIHSGADECECGLTKDADIHPVNDGASTNCIPAAPDRISMNPAVAARYPVEDRRIGDVEYVRVSSNAVAQTVDEDQPCPDPETIKRIGKNCEAAIMGHLYTEASIAVDNLSTDLSALRSENRLMRSVVDAAVAYTVEFKTGMTSQALQQLAIAVNAYVGEQP